MISVVVATYNGEKFILKQLDSILNQTLKPDEVIIRDDCSTDNTCKIIKNFINNNELDNWFFEINSCNEGYKKNFKKLLSLARGDFIFLSDQDDEWLDNKIEKMISIFKDNSEILALNGGVSLIDGESQEIKIDLGKNMYNANFYFSLKDIHFLNKIALSDLIINNVTPGCAMVIKKKLRDEFEKSYDGKLPHDWYLNMIAAKKNGCYYLNEPVMNYRIHSSNAIGLSSSAVKGFRKKLNYFDKNKRIKDLQIQIQATDKLNDDFGSIDMQSIIVQDYLRKRVTFYKNPSIINFLKMYKCKDYRDRTVIRGKLWDLVLAVRLESLISYLVNKKL
ncbi:MAG: glycosyltransferase family 2 protein [Liquorilactobacillus nagelii]|jgi:rhamnosyltransferase|uniref:glycosyltransferase family 2 protein n=1 Tax=Liquorilactobacillus nagelii TaxID=82688 RepID=UPI00242DD85E|nr:glycosyltransferase family 2 protein [Liquorilactobacillus nagelii]MCI1921425.1 glycosyltransferase family 2 protein [Liquorilactobacillus nagelii]MCI1977918.1 glycosyltransferase family 2 protein [Liquorilactobacillus nagelii]